MNTISVNKKSLNEIVYNINKNFEEEVVSVSLVNGRYNITIFGYGLRVCDTLSEAIMFVQGVGVGVLVKETIGKLK